MRKMMAEIEIAAPTFSEATDVGEVTHKSGYHKPDKSFYTRRRGRVTCGCSKTTEKGAYRDVTVEMPDGRVVHFYHQSPVVVEKNGRVRLSSCGWQTSTTKDRINRYLPSGYKLRQKDFEWFIRSWDPSVDYDEREYQRIDFEDGMVLEK